MEMSWKLSSVKFPILRSDGRYQIAVVFRFS